MKDEPRPVHEPEHATPAFVHDPTEDMTILGRWLQRGMDQGPRFWLLVGGVVSAMTALALLTSGLAAGKSEVAQAWIDLIPAKTPEDQLKVAEAHPNAPVADWARIRAAFEEYDSGLVDLTTPGKKETAGPRLKRALDLFQQVEREAPKDSPQRLSAALGVARTLEARNELDKAIRQYKLVSAGWAGTPEAKQAEVLAKALEDPENVGFYKELYAYKPPAATPGGPAGSPLDLPPGGTGSFDFKSMLPIPNTPAPAGLDAPPPAPPLNPAAATPKVEEAKAAPAPKAELPSDPFTPPKN